MPILTEEALRMQLPRMNKVKQKFDETRIEDVEGSVRQQLCQEHIQSLVKPGQSVAIAVGSRGIDNLSRIVKQTILCLQEFGAEPFIVPAMGSHGGATAEGQREVLCGYGVTEEAMGVPIKSSMDVTRIGQTAKGIPVYMDSTALAADMVVPIARVKPHTSFRGQVESGLCKMLAIGLGKHLGCSRLHQEGWSNMANTIEAVGEVFVSELNPGFGVALVENAFDQTAIIKVVVRDDFIAQDKELLKRAKDLMPGILVPNMDILVVEQMGKDISGGGMDPNITGRSAATGKVSGFTGPSAKRLVILGLTEASHGNASGIGSADFTTKKLFDSIDFVATYANMIASNSPEGARIPIVMDNEREAIIAAIRTSGVIGEVGPHIVRIKDTLHLGEIWVSESMLPLIKDNPRLTILE